MAAVRSRIKSESGLWRQLSHSTHTHTVHCFVLNGMALPRRIIQNKSHGSTSWHNKKNTYICADEIETFLWPFWRWTNKRNEAVLCKAITFESKRVSRIPMDRRHTTTEKRKKKHCRYGLRLARVTRSIDSLASHFIDHNDINKIL